MPEIEEDPWEPPLVLVAVDLVILTLRASTFHVLLIERGIEPYQGSWALPGGFLNNAGEGVFEAALRELKEEADLDGTRLHIEQLGAYGEPERDPRGRVLSVAYLAIAPGLPEPVAGTDASGAAWTPVEQVLSGRAPLAFDHQLIVADAVERARTKLEHSPLATAFCGETFTIAELRRVYETVWGAELDERNFYRKVQRVPGFIEPAGTDRRAGKGRPARTFRAGPAEVLHPPLTRPEPHRESEEER
ncbi:NUDIX hydrolase [Glycomyces xiaoerkulensis]|uniref:NUDIX hydrolase n=1 Tax=Glycomyces xiaoerkulensis TaxID=2038139 RepID=UPI0018E481D7|nr:NUDIX domain-containing protein [Glycomyces xiaoerkulensis]